MSLLPRAWRLLRPPVVYVALALGTILGVTALGMVTRGLLVEGTVPVVELLAALVGAVALLGVGLGLRVRAP